MNDPFSLTYNALWQLVDDATIFDGLVKQKNRIRFNHATNRDPIKQGIADADLPELMLVNSGIAECNLHSSSSTTTIARRYTWLLTTGDKRLQERLYPVQFALMCAMVNWKSVLGALRWNDQQFVKRCDLQSATDGMSDPERNRGIEGWSSQWTGDVIMVFQTSALKDHLQASSSS